MSADLTRYAEYTQYDEYLQRYAAEFFGDLNFDWLWFKAQAIAESRLEPNAVSPAGAVGLMQLMPGTYAEMSRRLGYPTGPQQAALITDPEINIRCGIAYDRRCWNIWKQEQGFERIRFMLASYNAGPGNIIKAQRLAIRPNSWWSLSRVLHHVTGRNAEETRNYVPRVERLYREMCGPVRPGAGA